MERYLATVHPLTFEGFCSVKVSTNRFILRAKDLYQVLETLKKLPYFREYGSKPVPIKPIIDTQKLLSNYNRKIPRSNGRNNAMKNILQNSNLLSDLIETFEKHEV